MKKFNFFEKLWEHSRTLRRVGLVLVMCLIAIPQLWAYRIKDAKIYYDDLKSQWGTKVVIAFGKGNENTGGGCGGSVYSISNITNTKLYYWSGSWGEDYQNWVSELRFGKTDKTYDWYDWWWKAVDNRVQTTWHLYQTDLWEGVSGNYCASVYEETVLFESTGSGAGDAITKNDISTFPDNMNNTQNVYYSVREGAGAYTAALNSGSTPAKLHMTSYKFVSGTYDAVSAESPSDLAAGGSTYTRSFSAARTATTSITVSEIADGYVFEGWYDAATGGNELANAETTTYTYYPRSTCNVYARFHKISYSLAGANWTADDINWVAGTVASGGTRLMTTTDGITYSTTMTGETLGGTRSFKLIKNQAWDANAIAANTDGVTKICYNGTLGDDGDPNHNFTLAPYLAGAITVSYNTSTSTLTVTCEEPIITFSKDGGDGGTSTQKTYSTKVTSSVEKPSKTGYNFAGYWSDDATPVQVIDANGAWMRNVSGYTDNNSPCKWSPSLNSNHTFTAHWTAKTYNIDLDRQQGSSGSTSVTMTYNSASHTAITAPTAPTGYTSAGWYTGALGTGSMVMNASGVLQANVDGYTGDGGVWIKDATCTLYAKYTATNYPDGYLYITDVKSVPETKAGTTITATLSGATYNASLNGSFAHSGLQYWALVGNSSDTYTLTFSSALTASATAAGVAVDVWWGANGTSSNSGTTVYLNGTSSSNKIGEAAANSDTRNQLLETLKNVRAVGTTSVTSLQLKRYNVNGAAWFRVGIKEIPGYKLTYDDGDGTGAPSASYQPNATIKLSSTIPTYAGHLFAGWQVDGSGTVYAPGDDFDMPAEATTLVAKWEEICFTGSITKSSSSYTVNSGATKDITSDASVTSGGAITIVNNNNSNVSYAFSSDGVNINTSQGYIEFSLPTGSVLTAGSIIRVQGKGSSASTGLKIIDDSGNSLKSQSASSIDFTYTVPALSAIDGNSYIRINRASDNGVKIKTVSVAGCGSVSCYTPAEPTISGTASYIVGETIELTADITGSNHDSNTEYTWYKGADWATASAADPVQDAAKAASNGHIFTKTAAVGDAGTYWCLASNDDDCEAHNETGKAITVVYKVTYDKNGGTGTISNSTGTSITLSDGTGFTAPSGYSFDGWNTAADGSGDAYTASQSSITANLDLYARWKQTVTLDKNGGSKDGSVVAYFNGAGPLATPTAPIYADHTVYDYRASDGTVVLTAAGAYASTSVSDESSVAYITSSKWVHSGATTLKAHWKCGAPSVSCTDNVVTMTGVGTIYYTTDGSTTPTSSSDAYDPSNKPVIAANTTIMAICIEDGCENSDVTTQACTYTCTDVDAVEDLECSAQTGTTLTYTWTKAANASGYTATLYSNSGCTSEVKHTDIDNGNTETVTFTSLSANTTYYCQVQSKGDGTTYCEDGGTTSAASGTTLAQYDVTIAVNPSGYGTLSASSVDDQDAGTGISTSDNELTVGETTITATPTSDGVYYTYAFSSWKKSDDSALPASLSGNLSVNANFTRTAVNYTLTWDVNGGDDLTGEYTYGTVAYGASITKPSDPTRDGYDFAGWDVTPASTMPAANTTYTAQWAKLYRVDYNVMGGDALDPAYEMGSSVTTIELPTPERSGYTFEGWYTTAGTLVDDDPYTPTADITLYAKWLGAACAGGSTTIISVALSGDYGGTQTVTGSIGGSSNVNNLGKSSPYKLSNTGAYVSAILSSGNYYQSGDVVTISGVDKQHVIYAGTPGSGTYLGQSATKVGTTTTYTLPASLPSNTSTIYVYRPKDNPDGVDGTINGTLTGITVTRGGGTCYQVTYDGNGATGGYVSDPAQYAADATVRVSSSTGSYTRTGYEFNGWNTKADGSGTKLSSFTITRDTTLYAQWRIVISSDNTDFAGKDYSPTQYKDVKVTNGATLTITNATTMRDVTVTGGATLKIQKGTTVHDITVETGSTLNISTTNGSSTGDGVTLTANSLALKGGWNDDKSKYDMPRVFIYPEKSTLTRTESVINFDISVDYTNYYPFALPFDVTINDASNVVDYAESYIAEASTYGTHYAIREYDGEQRAEGKAAWKYVPDGTTLKAGKGYIIYAKTVGGKGIIRFPLNMPSAWTTLGEQGSYSDVTKNEVAVTAWGWDEDKKDWKEGVPDSRKGWNLLGVPFMSCFDASDASHDEDVEGDAYIKGKLDFSTNKYDEEDDNIYVTVPVHDFSEYIQSPIDEAVLLPGWCFFIQVAKSGTLTFAQAGQEDDDNLPIYAPKREQENKPTVKTGIILSGNGASDKTTFLVSDKYSAAQYEFNADLEKMFGENSFTLATYSLSGETRLAYNALSNADAANIIPIGYRAPADGEYTFSINPRYAENGAFEHVNLIDYETGVMTDLLMGSYTFSTERTQLDTRFALNVVPRQNTPTDIENGASGINNANGPRKVLINDKMYIIVDGKMYDATGKAVK